VSRSGGKSQSAVRSITLTMGSPAAMPHQFGKLDHRGVRWSHRFLLAHAVDEQQPDFLLRVDP
jgi:hypothetical protein